MKECTDAMDGGFKLAFDIKGEEMPRFVDMGAGMMLPDIDTPAIKTSQADVDP